MGFEKLYQTHVDAVYGYLMFKLQCPELVEDLLQETFLAVYQAGSIKQITSPKAWILSIAHNKMVDHLRRKQILEHQVTTEQLGDLPQEHSTNLILQESLAQLADSERTIIYGLYVVGLTCQELSQILQIPEGTVKSKAHYARKQLRHWLKEGS